MKEARLICVGKLKTPFWKEAGAHYVKQLSVWRRLEIIEIRDGNTKFAPQARMQQEAERILPYLDKYSKSVALVETGAVYSSPQLAALLRDYDEKLCFTPTFIIGGPYGLAPAILEQCPLHLSLSAMTWPHELARVLLLEQLYRAESILRNSPYHHGSQK